MEHSPGVESLCMKNFASVRAQDFWSKSGCRSGHADLVKK